MPKHVPSHAKHCPRCRLPADERSAPDYCAAHHAEWQQQRRGAVAWARWAVATRNVAVLDTETTGLDDQAEVLEIALLSTQGEMLFDSLIRPQIQFPQRLPRSITWMRQWSRTRPRSVHCTHASLRSCESALWWSITPPLTAGSSTRPPLGTACLPSVRPPGTARCSSMRSLPASGMQRSRITRGTRSRAATTRRSGTAGQRLQRSRGWPRRSTESANIAHLGWQVVQPTAEYAQRADMVDIQKGIL